MKSNKRLFSIKNILSSASRKPKMALCGDNGGIWRFILNYSITAHHSFRTINKKINDRFIFWITKWAEYCLKFYIENMFKVCFPCKFRSQKILSKYFCEAGVVVSYWSDIILFHTEVSLLFKPIYLIAFYKTMAYIRQILADYCIFCKFLFALVWYCMY